MIAARTRVVAAAVALAVAAPSTALACINGYINKRNYAAKKVKSAEKGIRNGEYRWALGAIGTVEMMIHHNEPGLLRRARIAESIARIRLFATGSERSDSERVAEAVAMLRFVLRDRPDDPLLRARLAEGLLVTPTPEAADEAKTIVLDLAARDLIAEPEGWVAVATVRERDGDEAGRDAALKRCKRVAKARKAICRVTPA